MLVPEEVSSSLGFDSLYLLFTNLEGLDLPFDFSSLRDLRRVVVFLVCSAFCLSLECSDNFEVPYMLDKKLEL